ncbi:MAG: protein translocase subunit SecD [Dehalococcoidales bacterium]|nr:protein translocase subunit SecD [Dehalococcoidales bacterium]
MARRHVILFFIILAILAFTIWALVPLDGERFGRKGLRLGLDLVGGVHLVYQADFSENISATEKSAAMDRAKLTIEKRIDAFGVTEPVIQKLGEDRIMIQLPGFTDIEAAKKLVEQTGFLEFREVEKKPNGELVYLRDYISGNVTDFFDKKETAPRLFVNEYGEGKEFGRPVAFLSKNGDGALIFTDINGNPIERASLSQYGNVASWIPSRGSDGTPLTGDLLEDAQPNLGGSLRTEPEVDIKWDAKGSKIFDEIAARLYHPTDQSLSHALGIFLDNTLLSAPRVRAQSFQGRGVISGSFTMKQAEDLANLLRSGALPVRLHKPPLYQEKVSATLGAEFIDKSWKAGLIGIILIMLFMTAYYRLPGFVASVALVFYAMLTLAICKLWPITLSLGSIGGIIVSIGLAVDANVLIFERMKEELRSGRTLFAATENGFHRAWTAIFDSFITTVIACIILIWLATTAMRNAVVSGFAITLLIGSTVSLFTAITVTRTFLQLVINTPLAQKIWLFSVTGGKK